MAKRNAYKEMTLAQLRSFCEVCREEGFAPAARNLHLSSPAVWEQIQALERQLGLKLFQRQGSGVKPTLTGQRALELIQPLLHGLDSAQRVLQEEAGLAPQQVRLVSGVRMMQEEAATASVAFRHAYPQVRLSLTHPKEEDLDHAIELGAADLGLTFDPGPAQPPPATVVHELAYEMDYYLATPRDHPLARRTRLTLRDLVSHPLVLSRPEDYSRQRLEAKLYQEQLLDQMQVAAETSTAAVSLACVRAGLGVAVVVANPHGYLADGLFMKSLRHWFGPARFVFVWKRGAYRPQSHLFLAKCIQTAAGVPLAKGD
ncbi:LysR family transcriptional regulator [Lignipirellula cremea]|uniref:HTH-type transcriptional activator CmpR n=1 Tax=Lignipirellula cremea TaxID=2528010 RepID=A0A518DTX2_9BACT|nr:LysR family transcriptional regulator [Lignipirellula cremea]QDU95290.1 HTH-type transcriptional activator CmpR [Lignipirellula cremea]